MSAEKKGGEKEKVDPFFAVIAKVYGVPETGISAIGKQPYLNKDGRLYLLQELRKDEHAVKAIRVEFIKYSSTPIEPSIVKKTIEFMDGVSVEAIGEASENSVGKQSIKLTLNMVAETRALNRAIWVAIAADIMKRVQDNLDNQEISDEDKARIMEAGRVSYEEMERPAESAKEGNPATMALYDATVKRLELIGKDEAKLRLCLKNLPTFPLEEHQKTLLRERIERALVEIEKPGKPGKKKSTGKAGKKKAAPKKKVIKKKKGKK